MLLEHWTENPGVPSSILGPGTSKSGDGRDAVAFAVSGLPCGCQTATEPVLQVLAKRTMGHRGQHLAPHARAASAAMHMWDLCRTWAGWLRRRCSTQGSGDANLGGSVPA
jgi:hypothetical protein